MFASENNWLRDFYLCQSCKSLPRERALMQVIKTWYPAYRDLCVHESSPANRGASLRLRNDCPHYSASHYYDNVAPGTLHPHSGIRCEDLESMTFADAVFDLFITQDVMEHIFRPDLAFSEIARVLKPGGAHIFTAPLVNKNRPSERWASRGPGAEVIHHHDPEYHGNPVDNSGSLVTMHWGYDITEYIQTASGMHSTIVMLDNLDLGIRAEYIEVIVSRKPGVLAAACPV